MTTLGQRHQRKNIRQFGGINATHGENTLFFSGIVQFSIDENDNVEMLLDSIGNFLFVDKHKMMFIESTEQLNRIIHAKTGMQYVDDHVFSTIGGFMKFEASSSEVDELFLNMVKSDIESDRLSFTRGESGTKMKFIPLLGMTDNERRFFKIKSIAQSGLKEDED